MNKKGFTEFITNFFLIIFIILILTAYFIVFSAYSTLSGSMYKEIKADYMSKGDLVVSSYLRSNVIVDNKQIDFNDLIAIACVDDTYKEKLIMGTKKYMVMSQFFSDESNLDPNLFNPLNFKWTFLIECNNSKVRFGSGSLKLDDSTLESVGYVLDKNNELAKVSSFNVIGQSYSFSEFMTESGSY